MSNWAKTSDSEEQFSLHVLRSAMFTPNFTVAFKVADSCVAGEFTLDSFASSRAVWSQTNEWSIG